MVATFCFSIRLPRLSNSGCGTHGAEDRGDARGKHKEANFCSCIGRTSGDGSGRRSTFWVFSSPGGCLFLARICPVTTDGWSGCGTQGAYEGGGITAGRIEVISFDQKVRRKGESRVLVHVSGVCVTQKLWLGRGLMCAGPHASVYPALLWRTHGTT